ncbi:MAG TPA: tRNA uridine-5-carboxymethylaminomethyl(34) synthesis GTPase MnmE, partial [Casimicrobiaceae bacterium]|nr:tRNA uridine-5-carboxymethylaminomethyl(34) synthesis GTPase MnmE [Casimicrobiaceae bacterium]
SGDTVERLGIERTWSAVARADLALVLVDAREAGDGLHDEDRAILARLPSALPRIVVHNKIDPAGGAPRSATAEGAVRAQVWLSARTLAGIDLLEREVLAVAGVAGADEDAFIARARHVEALRAAAAHLAAAAQHLRASAPPLELYAEELRGAQQALAAITGEFTSDDLLGVIFGRFCIGK